MAPLGGVLRADITTRPFANRLTARWRLLTIFKFLAPYRSDEAIERGVSVTREVLRSTIDLARARGALPIIVVPQFTPEESEEREIRSRVLDEAGLTYVWVELDASWRVPNDGHPDARAAHAIAVAIANQLLSAGVSPGNESFKKADLELCLPGVTRSFNY